METASSAGRIIGVLLISQMVGGGIVDFVLGRRSSERRSP
jgi:hypothetical protein